MDSSLESLIKNNKDRYTKKISWIKRSKMEIVLIEFYPDITTDQINH